MYICIYFQWWCFQLYIFAYSETLYLEWKKEVSRVPLEPNEVRYDIPNFFEVLSLLKTTSWFIMYHSGQLIWSAIYDVKIFTMHEALSMNLFTVLINVKKWSLVLCDGSVHHWNCKVYMYTCPKDLVLYWHYSFYLWCQVIMT